MVYPAHIRNAESGRQIQSVSEHCKKSAEYAADTLGKKLRYTAYLAGILHDMGKYTDVFVNYINKAADGEKVKRGSVNHTFAGVRFVLERWHKNDSDAYQKLTSELIACAIGAHHGLFDCIDPDGSNGFEHRLSKEGIFYEDAKTRYLENCAGLLELDKLFNLAKKEVEVVFDDCKSFVKKEQEMHFCTSLIYRLLLSALISGDRTDTFEFQNDTVAPQPPNDILAIWHKILDKVENRLSKMSADSDIDKVRQQISDQCSKAADVPTGIYRLSVPTGGGKTLSGLRYAVRAAIKQNKKRIIIVAPLLSVIDQNAKVIKDWVGDASLVLEHHSNVVIEKASDGDLSENELLMETWTAAPIIITTLVQLLNTLFLGKTSCIRRTHALQDAVVIIDEVQSVPKNMLTLFNVALNFMSKVCNTTFVLCSATQPCLENTDHPVCFSEPADLVLPNSDNWDIFRRTNIIDKRRPEGYSPKELADFANECLEQNGSVLLICNTKAQAKQIFIEAQDKKQADVFHLSTAMCMEHRVKTLEEINHRLNKKLPVICVSTQLVEAGIDFSFGCVIRMSAGMDNIIQAAGRCNRHGEFGRLCPVLIVNFHKPLSSRLKEIKSAQHAAEAVLVRFKKNPELFDNYIASNKTISAYYRELYKDMPELAQDFFIKNYETSIYALLSHNSLFRGRTANDNEFILAQAFKTAGDAFCVFDDNTHDILVPYGEGKVLIDQLSTDKAKYSLGYRKSILDKTKRFSVSLFDYEFEELEKLGGIYNVCDGAVYVLQESFYLEDIGIEKGANNLIF